MTKIDACAVQTLKNFISHSNTRCTGVLYQRGEEVSLSIVVYRSSFMESDEHDCHWQSDGYEGIIPLNDVKTC